MIVGLYGLVGAGPPSSPKSILGPHGRTGGEIRVEGPPGTRIFRMMATGPSSIRIGHISRGDRQPGKASDLPS